MRYQDCGVGFSVPLGHGQEWRDNWDRIFGPGREEAKAAGRKQALRELMELTEEYGGYPELTDAPAPPPKADAERRCRCMDGCGHSGRLNTHKKEN